MKVIVMTGATSGIGSEAIKYFAEQSDTLIIIGARGSGRIVPKGTEVISLDLSSLESVRSFSKSVKQRLGTTPIDLLILNAGSQFGDNKQRSADGFELTFATNHLSHYLLARLLWTNMAKGGKLIITTSDTHDPEIIPFAPKTMDPKELAHPTSSGLMSNMRTYPSSKLCNLLTARSFASLSAREEKKIEVIAYNPGATGGTSLGGKPTPLKKFLITVLMRPLFSLLSVFKPAFYMGTPKRAGEALAELAFGKVTLPKDRIYASLVKNKITFPNPSVLAQDNDARDLLWEASALMVGLADK